MRVAFYTLGCKVNQYETQILTQLFSQRGYDVVSDRDIADVYVVNSCTVTQTGDKKSRQALHRFRRRSPGCIIALTGCFPQAFPEIAQQLEEVDIITGASNRAGLLDCIDKFLQTGEKIIQISPHEKNEKFESMAVSGFSGHTRAFVKIEDGCDRFCSYCIIPTARGRVRSKPLADISSEISTLAQQGYREIVLVGINLSSYGKDLGYRLVDAVETACAIDPIARVRLGSLEPELLTDEDIARLALLPKFCPQFHLSLQSGCDATLRRMNRHYTTGEYLRIVERLRTVFPNAAITTDIMVGFPGESEEEFLSSLSFVKQIGFAKVHVFAYSPRPGTRAAEMSGQIDASIKEQRSREMILAANQSRRNFFNEQVGQTVQVLFESREQGMQRFGYSENYCQVCVLSDKPLVSQLLPVLLTRVEDDGCFGTLL